MIRVVLNGAEQPDTIVVCTWDHRVSGALGMHTRGGMYSVMEECATIDEHAIASIKRRIPAMRWKKGNRAVYYDLLPQWMRVVESAVRRRMRRACRLGSNIGYITREEDAID